MMGEAEQASSADGGGDGREGGGPVVGGAGRWPIGGAKPVIGLAGEIGAGKSLVASQFAEMGAAVIDADALAKAALDEPAVKQTLQDWWGDGVLDGAGRVDRKAISQRVFDQPDALAKLEGLVHPRVHARRSALREQYQADPDVTAIVEDCPLLFEKSLDRQCDVIIVVTAPRATRQERVMRDRGWSAKELDRREKNQLPLDAKRHRAHDVINNDADPQACREQAKRVLADIFRKQPPRTDAAREAQASAAPPRTGAAE